MISDKSYLERNAMFPGINLGFKGELIGTIYKNKPASERIILQKPIIVNVGDIVICENITYSSYSRSSNNCKVTIIRKDGTTEHVDFCGVEGLHKGIWKPLPFDFTQK